MKLFKFRKTNSNLKAVLTIILSFSIYSFAFSQNTETKTGNQSTETTQTSNNRTTTTEGRVPTTSTTDTRDITLTEEEETAIALEETERLRREAEIAADAAKAEIIRRTFGSSLFANNKFNLTQAVNIATPNNYVLGPGDKLSVLVYGYSEEEQIVTVNADGNILLKRSGIVNVNGLPLEEAQVKIKNVLSKLYPDIKGAYGYAPQTFVKVSLSGFRSIKIRVAGEVVAPGTYTLTSFSSLMTSLYAAGGPNDIGTYRDIKLIRGNRVIAHLDLYDYIINGYSSADLLLKDQDVINVGPFISRVAVSGSTKRTGLFEMKGGEKLSDLIKYAGGFNQYAFTDLVKIYRNTSIERKIVNVDKADFSLEPIFSGDSLVVSKVLERIGNVINIEGAVFMPGEYSLDANPTLSQLIKSASGLREESLQGRINIERTESDLSVSNISVNLNDIVEGRVSDVQLKKLDRVFVPSIFDLTETSTIKIRGAINNVDAGEGVEMPYVKDMTIEDVLVRVGGLTEAASLSRAEIVRRKRNVDPSQIDAQVADILYFNISPDLNLIGDQESAKLMPFDEIIIRSSPNYEKQSYVKITGEVMYPGVYAIKYKDETISKAIEAAGGLTPLAYVEGATLSRKTILTERQRQRREEALANLAINNKIRATEAITGEEEDIVIDEDAESILPEDIGIDLGKILANPNNSAYDLILQDGDEIVIPKKLETVRIEGEVLYPTTVKYYPSNNFLSYITSSGGFTKQSAKGSAYIRYPNGSVDRTRKFLFIRFHPKVQPGSEIIVPAKSQSTEEQFGRFSGLVATISGTLATIVTIIGLIRLNN